MSNDRIDCLNSHERPTNDRLQLTQDVSELLVRASNYDDKPHQLYSHIANMARRWADPEQVDEIRRLMQAEYERPRTMPIGEYERLAMRAHHNSYHNSSRLSPDGLPIYAALGLAGEAGEFVDKIKKAWRNATPLDTDAAARELGDVLWYITACARDLGLTLEQVAQLNIDKLADRVARGVIKSEGDNR